MNIPEVVFHMNANRLSRLERDTTNSVSIFVNTISDEIVEDPTTGHRTLTGRSTLVQPPIDIKIHLCSSSHGDIYQLLRSKLVNHLWLCEELASEISTAPIKLGFGRDGFVMKIIVDITYQNVVVLSASSPLNNEALLLKAALLRLVLLGRLDKEERKMETESCSICLLNLTGSSKHGVRTRMTCSHVFHDRCLLEWLHRKNTCPLCRTVLYDLDDLASQEVSLLEN